MGKLIKIILICLSLYTPSLSFASPATNTSDLHRFTTGWVKQYKPGWNLNGMEMAWKIPEKKSIFKLSVSGSKHRFVSGNDIDGDAAIEFVDSLRVEFGDTYKVTQVVDEQVWLMSLAYEFYPWEKEGDLWRLKWRFYPSLGIMGQYGFVVQSTDYLIEFNTGADEPLVQKLGIPTSLDRAGFDMIFPACFNFDFSIITLRSCGLFYTNDKPTFSVTISGGL